MVLLGGCAAMMIASAAHGADAVAATQPGVFHLPAADIEGVSQPAEPGRTGVIVQPIGDHAKPQFLPPVADTALWKQSPNSQGSGNAMVLRDNRWSQGLVKLNVDAIDPTADFTAVFHFKVGGVERKGQPAVFTLHRMLTDWSESATWFKPSADSQATWNGLKPGVDYVAEPFAKWETPSLNTNQLVDIGGVEKALKAWRDGSWPNDGFLLLLNGKALQCSVPTREAALMTSTLLLGGKTNGMLVLRPDVAVLKHTLIQPDDLIDATLRLAPRKQAKSKLSSQITLQMFHALRPIADQPLQPGVDYDAKPIASCTIQEPAGPETAIVFTGLADAVRRCVSGEWKEPELLVSIADAKPGDSPLPVAAAGGGKDVPEFTFSLKPVDHAVLFDNDVKIQPGVYATVKDGHLYYGGKRLRLWGTIGSPHADRLVKMGFNAERLWNPRATYTKTTPGFYSEQSLKRGEPVTYIKGDNSLMDQWDRHLANDKAHNIFVMLAALENGMRVEPLAADDSFIAPKQNSSFDAGNWEEWKKAVLAPKSPLTRAIVIDDRLQAIRKRAAKNLLTHVNLYTGKEYGQEECIAVYEVFNENGFTKLVLDGGTDKWPAFFQWELQQRWNQWLKTRYGNDAAMIAAWGKVDPGESLERGTVKSGPTLPMRTAYPAARAADFIHFVIDITDHFNQDFRAYCRSLAPKGVGVNVAPFSFDTQYRPCLPWNYTNSLADVNCFGMYFWDLTSSLAKPPSAYVIDSNTVDSAATILYETNAARPGPFRAEYPLKLAALAGWQDWDGVFWHYWSPAEPSDESYLTTAMGYPNVSHFWTAVQHQNDPVMCTAMSIAGRIFLNHDVHPAPKPAIVDVGADALFGYNHYNGIDLAQETFTRGTRTRFEPNKPGGVTIDGQPQPPPQRLSGAVATGDQIIWDWPHGRLLIDIPTVHAYVGKFTGPYKFKDGIVLSNVSTPSVSFAMVSADGKPLVGTDAAHRIYIAAVADARNTGFQFKWDVQGGPLEQAAAVIDRGRAPVVVDKVDYTLWFPTGLRGKFDGYDFALRDRFSHALADVNQISSTADTMYMSVLTIKQRGEPMATPDVKNDIAVASQAATEAGGAANAGAPTGPWNPISLLSWDTSYGDAHKTLRESSLIFSSISPEDLSNKAEKTITLSDLQLPLLWKMPADVDITFSHDHMQAITATSKQPPPFEQAVADFQKRFGSPAAREIGAQYQRSLARWDKVDQALTVTLTESQGILKVIIEKK
jgi:hypothetical protein